MVRTPEEILNSVLDLFEDNTSDECLSLLGDIKDTFDSNANNDSEDWKTKYEENDKHWREKFRDTFINGKQDTEAEETGSDKRYTTFESLFETEG